MPSITRRPSPELTFHLPSDCHTYLSYIVIPPSAATLDYTPVRACRLASAGAVSHSVGEHEGFRETLLLHFTDPEANATLHCLGDRFLTLSLECAPSWPHHTTPRGETRSELRAALADLRHLEGFLSGGDRSTWSPSLGADDDALSRFAARLAQKLARTAEEIKQAIGEGGVAVARIPTPLTWKRRNFAVFEHQGMIDRLYAIVVSGLRDLGEALHGKSW